LHLEIATVEQALSRLAAVELLRIGRGPYVRTVEVGLCASTCRDGRDGYSKLDSFVLFPLFASGYAGRIEAIRIAASPFQET
jgi:hypothetical protein